MLHNTYISPVRVLVAAITVLALLVPTATFAEDVALTPEVYVKSIVLEEQIVQPGQVLSGVATLVNPGDISASGVMYDVRVVGGYDEVGIPAEIYGSTTFGPFFVPAKSEREVPFTITLPRVIADENAGIEIQTSLESGTPLGWGDTRILVQGVIRALTVTDGFVTVTNANGTQDPTRYELNHGPTVHDGMAATVGIEVLNEIDENITLTPVIAISEMGAGVSVMPEMVYPNSFTVPAGQQIERSFTVPTSNLESGVYVGTLTLQSEEGIPVTGEIGFRYIIGGEFATIKSVSSDKESLSAGESTTVVVSFAGIPFDINGTPNDEFLAAYDDFFENPPENPEDFAIELDRVNETLTQEAPTQEETKLGAGVVRVVLFNEHDQEVAAAERSINIDDDYTASLLLTAERNAEALRAEVEIVRGEERLAFASFPLSLMYDELREGSSSTLIVDPIIAGAVGLVALIILVAIIFLIRSNSKKSDGPSSDASNTISTLIVLFGVFASAAIFFGAPHAINAYTITDSCWQRCMGHLPQVYINTPSVEVDPGQTFNIKGTVTAAQCTNSPSHYVVVYGRNNGGPWKVISRTNRSSVSNSQGSLVLTGTYGWRGKVYGTNNRFHVGPFTAPEEEGTYQVEVWTYYHWIGNHGIVEARGVKGFQEYTVPDPNTQADLTASEPEVYSGELLAFEPTSILQTAFSIGGFSGFNFSLPLGPSGVVFASTITNISPDRFAIGPFSNVFEIDLGNDGTWDVSLAADSVNELGRGMGTAVRSSEWTPEIGTHAVRACADSNNTIDESDETNNCSPSNLVFTVNERPQCSDGIDNDGDGNADFYGVYSFSPTFSYLPSDAGCSSPQDPLEAAPQCSDGIDNDGNGLIDFPDDPSCSAGSDDFEQSVPVGEADLTFDANPRLVREGDTITLEWSATNVEEGSCVITGTNGDSWSINGVGSVESSEIETETTFTLSCTSLSDASVVTKEVTIRLVPSFEEQ